MTSSSPLQPQPFCDSVNQNLTNTEKITSKRIQSLIYLCTENIRKIKKKITKNPGLVVFFFFKKEAREEMRSKRIHTKRLLHTSGKIANHVEKTKTCGVRKTNKTA